jgi:serine/threonine protein kinase
MGEVYQGSAPDIGRQVAIKRMLKGDSTGEIKDLFLREVAVCATLEHPNVVEVIDAGQSAGDLFLVMEFVDGPSLAELLEVLHKRNERLPVEITCGIIAMVARGLAHAHERSLPDGTSLGIVHRDVAAENVLISRSGLPKLVDFGLAKLAGHDLTTPGTIRGRPRALAPEQARGEKIDARCDIFALGAMMFELASGQHLYPHEQLATVLWKVVAGDYDPLPERMPGVDPDLVRIIQTAVNPEPKDRFRSAREMERALDNFRAARGMRIESSRIASLISRSWPEVQALREVKRTDGPGEMEGSRLVLSADRLDTSTNVEVPPDLLRRVNAAAQSAAEKKSTSNPGQTPSKPLRRKRTPAPEPAIAATNANRWTEARGTPGLELPDLETEAARSLQTDTSAALRSELRSSVDAGLLSAAGKRGSELPRPKPARPGLLAVFESLGSDRGWYLFLGAILFVSLIAFLVIWIFTRA